MMQVMLFDRLQFYLLISQEGGHERCRKEQAKTDEAHVRSAGKQVGTNLFFV